MHRLFSALIATVVLAVAFVASPQPAQAKRVAQDCTNGFLVGFETRRGVWLDRIGAICQAWDPFTVSLGDDEFKPMLAHSRGGSPETVRCDPGFAVVDMDYFLPTNQGQSVVEELVLTCQRVKWPHNGSMKQPPPTLHTTGSHANDNDPTCMGVCATGTHAPVEACDVGQIATGFDADVSEFVGRLKIHCGPWPSETPQTTDLRHHFPRHDVPGTTGGAPAPGQGPPGSNVVEGDWKTSEGAMTFNQNGDHLDATYGSDGGRVSADRAGSNWVGFWAENSSNHRCDKMRLGSHFWGNIELAFRDGNRLFDAKWSYCNAPTTNGTSWTGFRIQ